MSIFVSLLTLIGVWMEDGHHTTDSGSSKDLRCMLLCDGFSWHAVLLHYQKVNHRRICILNDALLRHKLL